jgi:hypothetical protein
MEKIKEGSTGSGQRAVPPSGMKTGFCRWLIARKGFLFPYTSMSVRGQSGTADTLTDSLSVLCL